MARPPSKPALAIPTLDGFKRDAIRLIASATGRACLPDRLTEVRKWGTDQEIEASLIEAFQKQAKRAIAELQRLHSEAKKNVQRLVYLRFRARPPYDRCLGLLDGSLAFEVGDDSIILTIPVLHPTRVDKEAKNNPGYPSIPDGVTHNDFLHFERRGDGGMFRAQLEAPVVIKSKNLGGLYSRPLWEHGIKSTHAGGVRIVFGDALEEVVTNEECDYEQKVWLVPVIKEHLGYPLRRHLLKAGYDEILKVRRHMNQETRAFEEIVKLTDDLRDVTRASRLHDRIPVDGRPIAARLRLVIQKYKEEFEKVVDDVAVVEAKRVLTEFKKELGIKAR